MCKTEHVCAQELQFSSNEHCNDAQLTTGPFLEYIRGLVGNNVIKNMIHNKIQLEQALLRKYLYLYGENKQREVDKIFKFEILKKQ